MNFVACKILFYDHSATGLLPLKLKGLKPLPIRSIYQWDMKLKVDTSGARQVLY